MKKMALALSFLIAFGSFNTTKTDVIKTISTTIQEHVPETIVIAFGVFFIALGLGSLITYLKNPKPEILEGIEKAKLEPEAITDAAQPLTTENFTNLQESYEGFYEQTQTILPKDISITEALSKGSEFTARDIINLKEQQASESYALSEEASSIFKFDTALTGKKMTETQKPGEPPRYEPITKEDLINAIKDQVKQGNEVTLENLIDSSPNFIDQNKPTLSREDWKDIARESGLEKNETKLDMFADDVQRELKGTLERVGDVSKTEINTTFQEWSKSDFASKPQTKQVAAEPELTTSPLHDASLSPEMQQRLLEESGLTGPVDLVQPTILDGPPGGLPIDIQQQIDLSSLPTDQGTTYTTSGDIPREISNLPTPDQTGEATAIEARPVVD